MLLLKWAVIVKLYLTLYLLNFYFQIDAQMHILHPQMANIFSTLKFIPFTTLPTILCLHCSLPHFVCEALFSIALVTKNLAACFTLRTSRLRWIWPSELTRLCTNGQLTILYLNRHLDKLYFRFRS